uniref:Small EDRK-rich factor-like N-terminal domain-containing protein n=4 Tax=Cercopithecinae TaxID=9528 RepID=A0A2K5NMT7_CERAT
MTRGNQRELARQKNMKKQSDSVKGKRRDDGLSAAARKQSAITSFRNFLYPACVYFPSSVPSPPRKYTQTYYAAVPAGWWGSGGGPATQPAAGGRWRFLHILGTQPQSH